MQIEGEPTAVEKGESFGGVRKRNRPFAWRIKCCEEIDEQGDHPQMRRAFVGDIEAKASCKERPGHMWKGEQKQVSAPEAVNTANRWPCKSAELSALIQEKFLIGDPRKIDQTKAPRHKQSTPFTGIGICE